jgi:lysophospholipase L1-like esterase
MIRAALLYHVYSGHLFFTAAALILSGLLARKLRALVLLGLALAAMSGTPMPLWLAVPALVVSIAAIAKPDRKAIAAGAAALTVAAVAFELPHHLRWRGAALPCRRLFVVGDSLASGGFGETLPWPRRLGAMNLARPSDTAAGAREQAALLPPPAPGDCVIVEIGGNDMLERAPQFAESLEALLRDIRPRTSVILELPLIPGAWSYGAAQRRLAGKFEALLVPKRVLAGVLVDPRNTSDGLHLTERGHARLAHDLAQWVEGTEDR